MYITMKHDKAPKRLEIAHYHFLCPYCWKTWHRGGHQEGFVKASASRHVYACYEVWLYGLGWVNLGMPSGSGKYHLEKIEDAKENPANMRFMRSLENLVRKRAREAAR